LSRALLFSHYLEAHARRVYSYAARPDFDAARTILSKIKNGKLPMEFTGRTIYRNGWSGLSTAGDTEPALRLLCDYGYLLQLVNPIGPEGGRPSIS
jgi:putative DNA primase/helicase